MRDDDRATSSHASTSASTSAPGPNFGPQLSLPTGGGALRSIGDKFGAHHFTGAGTLTVPLPISPARFAPTLSLTYATGAGNGPLGLGWQLAGVPAISRKTDKGAPQYRDFEPNPKLRDTFILAGADDLVPALDEQGQIDAEYIGNVLITRHRPRIESGFASIERHANIPGAFSHWRVVTADNVTHVFGRSAAGRVRSARGRTFSWLLEESHDDRGNIIRYEWVPEDLAGVDVHAPHEAPRLLDGPAQPQRYLARILYGNATPFVAEGWTFEVVFDYGGHGHAVGEQLAITPEPERPWPVRADTFSSCRVGFELRTRRLLRRVLMFHRFPELGEAPTLVASTDLVHDEQPNLTRLIGVVQRGYRRDAQTGHYEHASLPMLELEYASAALDPVLHELDDPTTLANLPRGVDGRQARLIDLDGEGLPGIVIDHEGWRYFKRGMGEGRFGAMLPLPNQPTSASLATTQIVDIDGDGRRELVRYDRPYAGFHRRDLRSFGPPSQGWLGFQPLLACPTIDFRASNVTMVDLYGRGLAELLVDRGERYDWYRSRGAEGFERACWLLKPYEPGTRTIANLVRDRHTFVDFADMTGDGLPDLVRVRNGEIVYWPNLGSGEFGHAIRLQGPLGLASAADLFDPRRVRLADVDGSGTADLLYLDERGATLYRNLAGNALAPGEVLDRFPCLQLDTDWAEVVDLEGSGTASLVWSSRSVAGRGGVLRRLDLHGGRKPHLLTRVRNGMGAETRISYAPSTTFYLADERAGRPWHTRVPFPVHVVTRIESIDHVTAQRHVQRFAYHHGHHDGLEREFRGFGMVETWDADEALEQPPIHTKTWFHTGAQGFTHVCDAEAWAGDPLAAPLPAGHRMPPGDDAVRALAGQVLCTEVYADDGTLEAARPFVVTRTRYEVRELQSAGINPYAVMLVHPRETVSAHYDRVADDPRVTHEFVLEVDEHSVVRRTASLVYPRRVPDPGVPEQAVLHATCSELDVVHVETGDVRRIGVPIAARRYELLDLPLPAPGARLSWQALHDAALGPSKRLLEHTRSRYFADDLSGPLPLGTVESKALVHSSETMVMSEAQRLALFDGLPGVPDPAAGGYVLDDGAWWARGAVPTYDPARFFVTVAQTDPFGNVHAAHYDAHALLISATIDPLGNTTTAELDYRLLRAWRLTDPNGNRSSVAFDVLGFVVRSAIAGKQGEALGDTLDDPTTRFEYDLHAWEKGEGPCWSRSLARETHGDPETRWLERRTYVSGTGRVVMTKTQARPGLAPQRDAQGQLVPDEEGQLVIADTSPAPRWIGSGRTIHDNKGNLVKAYEPYFSSTPGFESEAELVEQGVTAVLRYDALGRLVRTDLPDGTLTRTQLGPWRHTSWDANDCVLESTWFAARSGDPGNDVAQQKEHRAALLAAKHADTPSVTELDTLGRAVRAIAHNREDGLDVMLETRSELDVQGRVLKVFDARGNLAEQRTHDMLGRALVVTSHDAGTRWSLPDASGQAWHAWDSRGHHQIVTRDALCRPVDRVVALGNEAPKLVARNVYGEQLEQPELTNHRGRILHTFDGAGLATTLAYDFAGHPTSEQRRLLASKTDTPDWSPLLEADTLDAMTAAAANLLEAETFSASSTHDALGRVLAAVSPDGSVTRYVYDEGGALQRVTVNHRGAAQAQTVIGEIEHDAKGRRTRVVYGPADAPTSTTRYTYDALSGRLLRLRTVRASDDAALQSLHYHHDAVGNVTDIRDTAQATVYFANAVVEAANSYEYDALYRLIEATGREHAAEGTTQRTHLDLVATPQPMTSDPSAMRRYTQRFTYDAAGNLLELRHIPSSGNGWTRRYQVDEQGNRLLATSAPGDLEGQFSHAYQHDAHGNMTAMPHLAALVWSHDDQLVQASAGAEALAFQYTGDARVRKHTSKPGATTEERIYVGAFELYRKRVDGVLVLERESLHVSDDTGRVALIETKTVDQQVLAQPGVVWRFQLSNHLGSACTEITETGAVISHEEMHPYGTSAYRAVDAAIDVSPSRYRFTGMERDEETGLAQHGARYYACWLACWTSSDPSGLGGGLNRFAYCSGNPINLVDPSGHWGAPTPQRQAELAEEIANDPNFTSRDAQLAELERRLAAEGAPKRTEPRARTRKVEEVTPEDTAPSLDELAELHADWNAEVAPRSDTTDAAEPDRGPSGPITVDPYGIELIDRARQDAQAEQAEREFWKGTVADALAAGGERRLDVLQGVLAGLGMVPGIGAGADLMNAGLSLMRGRYREAGEHTISAVPGFGDAAGAAKIARGANNPKTRRAAEIGQEAHRQIQKTYRAKGYKTESAIKLSSGKVVRKDARKGNEVVIIKPDTTSGRRSAARREKLMREDGYNTKIHLYDPTNPAYSPTSPTYIGPKPKRKK